MANPTGGFGLRAVRRIDGAALSFQVEARQIAYNNAHVMATGDLVKILNTGYIDAYVAADSNTVTLGVFQGCKYRDPNAGYTVWRPIWNAVSGLASTDKVTAYIHLLDPMLAYEIRSGTANAVTIASIGLNADVVVGTPNATTGQSAATLDTPATTATLPLRIVALGQAVGNDNTLANNVVEVVPNSSSMLRTTGVGG